MEAAYLCGLYLQDSWKITPKLTLEYGLRWDYQSQGHEIYYRNDEFAPHTPNPSAGNLPGAIQFEGYGTGRCNCLFSHGYPYAIGPRIGAAWQVAPKTVIRAGWGIAYGQLSGYGYVTNQNGAGTVGIGWNVLTFNSPAFGQAGAVLGTGLQYNPALLTASEPDSGDSADARHDHRTAIFLRSERRAGLPESASGASACSTKSPAICWWKPTSWGISACGKPPAPEPA